MEDAFIGRQAILDLQKSVYAYEILFRSGLKNAFDPNLDGNVATQSVMCSRPPRFSRPYVT